MHTILKNFCYGLVIMLVGNIWQAGSGEPMSFLLLMTVIQDEAFRNTAVLITIILTGWDIMKWYYGPLVTIERPASLPKSAPEPSQQRCQCCCHKAETPSM